MENAFAVYRLPFFDLSFSYFMFANICATQSTADSFTVKRKAMIKTNQICSIVFACCFSCTLNRFFARWPGSFIYLSSLMAFIRSSFRVFSLDFFDLVCSG